MAQLSTTYEPNSVTSRGDMAGGAMAGLNVGALGPLLNQLAARKAAAEAKAQADADAARQAAEEDAKWRRGFAERQYRDSRSDARLAQVRADHERAIAQFQPSEEHWFKNFGIGKGGDFGGPVEVAPGTFGAYVASIPGAAGASERAAARGLTPGLAGQKIGGTDTLLGGISGSEATDDDLYVARRNLAHNS